MQSPELLYVAIGQLEPQELLYKKNPGLQLVQFDPETIQD